MVAVEHLTVYYDPEHAARDGRGFCVDHDHADNEEGRVGGDTGYRFKTAKEAGEHVAYFLDELRK